MRTIVTATEGDSDSPSSSIRTQFCVQLTGACLVVFAELLHPFFALSQPLGDVFSSQGQYDPYAVGGAHRWYDNHTDEFKQKSSHCLPILDEAKTYQDKALELYDEAKQPGNSRRQTELVKQGNEQIKLRGERLRAFTDCVNQANRRPMLQGKVEQNEGLPSQQPEEDKKTPPQKPQTKTPPPKKVPPLSDPGPETPTPLPTPLPPSQFPPPSPAPPAPIPPSAPPSGSPSPGGGSDQGPGRYKFGQPDPPFMFADGVSKGMGDCFADNLPMDLATAPLAVIKRLERLKKAVEVIGRASSIYAIYEDIKAYDPTADPYEIGKWLGKLICDGKDLGQLVKQKKKLGPEPEPPTEPAPTQSLPEEPATPPSNKKEPPPPDPVLFPPKTHFPPAPDPLKRGMPLEDHKQLVNLAVGEKKIIVVRDSNPWAMRWAGRPRHAPKPQDVKGKTIPYDPKKPPEENQFAGLASAKGMSDAERRALLAKKYTIRGKEEIIVDPKGNRLYSDTDLHGVYDLNGKDAWSPGMQQKMNDSFLEKMVQHDPHDVWPDRNNLAVAGPNAGPKPPITAYLPDGTTQHMTTIDQMKQFYQAYGMDWNSLYPGY